MPAPAYLEHNGRAALPTRLRPSSGGTLSVVFYPRPPEALATLANADQAAVASVSWVDDDGTGHLEPLWTTVQLPGGGPLQPSPEGTVVVDRYSGTFVRARAEGVDFTGGAAHPFAVGLAATAGPGGALLADTAELRAMGGAVWWDQGGALGKVYTAGGAELMAPELADMIDAGAVAHGTLDTTTDPTHPALRLSAAASLPRRRATLADLFATVGQTPELFVTIQEAGGGTELDVIAVGSVPLPPEPKPAGWVDGPAVLLYVGALSPIAPDDAAYAESCAASVNAAVDTYLDQPEGWTPSERCRAEVCQAARIAAADLYKRREAPFGLTSGYTDMAGVALRVARDPLEGVRPMLDRWRRVALA
jgi:hypothetical protein